LADRRAFVLVDGLDEVSDPEVRIEVRNALLEGQVECEGNRWLFTSRIVGYTLAPVFLPPDEAEVEARLKAQSRALKLVSSFTVIDESGRKLPPKRSAGEPDAIERNRLIRRAAQLLGTSLEPSLLESQRESASTEGVAGPGKKGLDRAVEILTKRGSRPVFYQHVSGESRLMEPPLRYVTPFLPDAVAQFAKNWFNLREPEPTNAAKRTGEFLAALASRSDLSELARTPQLLGMMCLVHYYQARLPDGRAELYQSVVRAYLIDIPRIIGRDIAVDPEDRIRWLSAIGFRMQQQRTIEKKKIDDVGVTVPEPTLRGWLRDIGVVKDQIDIFIHFLGRRAGLLLPRGKDEHGNEVYAFLHLSFQEYFAARYLAERDPTQPRSSALASLGLTEPSSRNELDRRKFLAWSRDSVWQETFRLLFQIHALSQADNLAGVLFKEFERLVKKAIREQTHARKAVGNLGFLLSDVVLDGKSRISESVRRGLCARLIEWEFHSQVGSNRLGKEWGNVYVVSNIMQLLSTSIMSGVTALPTEVLSSATALDLRNTPVSDLSPIKELKQITTLYLANTQVSDLTPIKELQQLTTLILNETQVSDLSPIKELKQLTTLVLNDTQVSDLSPIKELQQLTTLWLNDTPVSNLSPIKELKQLRTLDLGNTPVSNLSPIKELKQLTGLYLYDTQVSDAQKEELKKHLPNLKIID
jgi:internalin A